MGTLITLATFVLGAATGCVLTLRFIAKNWKTIERKVNKG